MHIMRLQTYKLIKVCFFELGEACINCGHDYILRPTPLLQITTIIDLNEKNFILNNSS